MKKPSDKLRERREQMASMAAKIRATVIAAPTPEERTLIRLTPDTDRAMFAENLWTRFVPKAEIIEQIQQVYSVSAAMASADLNRVIRYYIEVDKETRTEIKSQMRATLKDGYRRCVESRDYGPGIQYLDKLCRLDGLYEKEVVVTALPPSVQIDPTKLTKEQREALRIVQALMEPSPVAVLPNGDERHE